MREVVHDGHALVVLPRGARLAIGAWKHVRWLSRGKVSEHSPTTESLRLILTELGESCPSPAYGALRFWGQTGERSSSWMVAADPVYLEPRLRDVRVRTIAASQVSHGQMRQLFDTLQNELGDDAVTFARFGGCGYLHSEVAFAVPSASAAVAAVNAPDRFVPNGKEAKTYHGLLGEIQMLLHDHAVNVERQSSGQPPINSLWIWGGGIAPQASAKTLPDLYSDDALYMGYWASCENGAQAWQGIDHCLENSPQGFVAVLPEATLAGAGDDANEESLLNVLDALRNRFRRSALRRLSVLFDDGLIVRMGRRDYLKFWHKPSPHFEAPVNA